MRFAIKIKIITQKKDWKSKSNSCFKNLFKIKIQSQRISPIQNPSRCWVSTVTKYYWLPSQVKSSSIQCAVMPN